ncbi:MAG TPA: c-type cytochrome [Verrucomicrobiae bacterium]|nr:c-type cytochrome [Verrucomicrobiae bacterium]
MPPDKSPKLYDLKKTAFWFFVASFVLLLSLAGMILQDSTREWKVWQKKFMAYKREKIQAQLETAKKAMDAKQLETLKAELAQADKDAAAKRGEIKALEKERDKINLDYTVANKQYQTLKQYQDSNRYFYEEVKKHNEEKETEHYDKMLKDREPKIAELKKKLEGFEAQRDEKQAAIDALLEHEKKLQKDVSKMTKDVDQFQQQIKKLSPSLVKNILNAPMLDFIAPSLQIQQIVVSHLYDDYYFQKVPKVDRCVSCHLGIDQKGFEDAPQPFRTHPNLDLYLGQNSPHPMETIGCTICHGGSGHSANFTTSAHTPQNEDQAKAWKKKYHWHEMHHWADKMLPLNHVQASCTKCHQGELAIPGADKLNEGRRLAQTNGCYACHKVDNMQHGEWKVGPNLTHIQSKVESDWIVRWLQNPKEFRASTKMPRIFHLSNTSDKESVEKSNAAIAGIAAYLTKNSDPVDLTPPPVQGDAENGKKIFQEVGCMGCHSKGEIKGGEHGPELVGLGSKVKADWLYTWLKNPKHYWPDTRMPNLRLSDQEAADLTAFLLADKNEKFEGITPPRVSPEVVDTLAMAFMTGRMRQQEARASLDKMSAEEKLEYVGKQSISHQGCMGCHDIKGFEDAKRIGTDLTEEGSKEIKKLDFALSDLPHTREAWFFQKMKDPRFFDQGKVKTYHEKLRMPNFDFTDEQADALTTFLLSLQKAYIPMDMKKNLDLNEKKVEEGRLIVARFNCNGCHTLDGKDGLLRTLAEDPGNAPPILKGEGKKVQGEWLYHFIQNPTTIRPWLKYRMPTFGFDEAKLNTLVEYFHNLDKAQISYKSEAVESTPEKIDAGRQLFTTLQCIKCHKSNPEPGLTASFLAPDLTMAKHRLQADWVPEWLKDPQALLEGTMMPTFFADGQSPIPNIFEGDAVKQIEAIRDYLWQFTPEEAQKVTQAAAAASQG